MVEHLCTHGTPYPLTFSISASLQPDMMAKNNSSIGAKRDICDLSLLYWLSVVSEHPASSRRTMSSSFYMKVNLRERERERVLDVCVFSWLVG